MHRKSETRGRKKQGSETKLKKKTSKGQPQPGGGRTKKEDKTPRGRVRRTKTGRGGLPARPGQEEHACAHTRGTQNTRNSPGAPAESPVKTRRVRETRRVSARVHTRQTTAAHAPKGRSQRDPPETAPSRDPERVQRGSRPVPLPPQGPAAGTMSPVLGWPPCAPRSRPVNPGAKAPGRRRHHADRKADRSTESDRTRRGPVHQRGARRHTTEARRRPQPRRTDRCQVTTATGCRKPGRRAQQARNHGTGEGAKEDRAPQRSVPAARTRDQWGEQAPTPAHSTQSQWVAGPGRTPQGRAVVGG